MNIVVALIIGLVAGLVIAGVAMWLLMPSLMLKTHVSRFKTIDETVDALKEAIESTGWNCPMVRDMNASMAKENVNFEAPIRVVELCNANYANQVLSTNPEVSTLMPCAWGVYKKGNEVMITGMNMGLMGKMFGGNIGRVMGGYVAKDEATMLAKVTKR